MKDSPVSLTLKNVPAHLHRLLKRRAREHKRSLNQEAILCLERTLAAREEAVTSLLDPPVAASAGALLQPWTSRSEMLDGFLDREQP